MATSLDAATAAAHTATGQLQKDGGAAHEPTKGKNKKNRRDGGREGKKLNAAELRNYTATEAPECRLPLPETRRGGTPSHTCGATEP